MASEWSVYIVRCADNSLYTGISTCVARRFQEHSAGGVKSAKYLRGRSPLQLVFQERVGTRSEAAKVEFAVKQLSKQDKEQLIIRGTLPSAGNSKQSLGEG